MLCGWNRLSEDELQRIARGIAAGRPLGGPWHLELMPSDRCNLNCFFCFNKEDRRDAMLPWEILKPTLERAAKRDLRFLRLTGGGEGLLYSDMEALLDLCAERSLRFSDVTTNGAPLRRFASRLIEVGTDIFSISLNEPTPELYARSMRSTERAFHQAIEGVQALNQAREAIPEKNRPEIHLKFFLWKDNHKQLRELYDLALSLQADQIQINAIQGLDAGQKMNADERETAKKGITEIIAEDQAGGRPRLVFNLQGEKGLNDFAFAEQLRLSSKSTEKSAETLAETERTEYCYMGWYAATIAADGEVYPCCNFAGQREKSMGNIGKRSLEDIWEGKQYRHLRKEFRSLALLGGEAEHSRRYHRYMEPLCIARRACPFTFSLCSSEFYRLVSEQLNAPGKAVSRTLAKSSNALLKAAHKLRNTQSNK